MLQENNSNCWINGPCYTNAMHKCVPFQLITSEYEQARLLLATLSDLIEKSISIEDKSPFRDFYVYALLDPRPGPRLNLPFYIGKGRFNRYESHFKESPSESTNLRRRRIIHECKRHSLVVEVLKIKENLTSDQAYFLEEELIEHYGRFGTKYGGGILMNKRRGY